ncbi:ABC transporter ATP-binding protein [Cellulosimicrobium sp. Marseille-Q4280]|uniref:ABC transporter ATP-binding protein n=1 Tax=Cellulosimicrobium sp. Marseille-Q4280 TaxID=2937992 RepID=UPI0020422B62|nr:ABC transporter ATP-binding protein [Cellulosimicrobium sp. Marseille-Q4280]
MTTAPRPAAAAATAVATAAATSSPDAVAPVIEVRHLRKTYPGPKGSAARKVAVEDVSFSVAPGEIFGILGPNGAGKTTTVECLAGLREADGGSVRVFGVDPQTHPERVRDALGIQLQESALNERITVAEAMRLFASFYEAPADADELLELLELAEHRGVAYAKLSGGQKQRLSIALALVGNPRVAILDELTTGLDPQARRTTWDLVERVRARGVTVLLVTHFMDEAERLCDRLVVIDRGRVVASGSPAELIDALDDSRTMRLRVPAVDHDVTLHTLAGLADVERIEVVDAVRPADREIEVRGSRRVLPAVVLALAEHDIVPDDVRTLSRSLEDVFVAVTGRTYDPTAAATPATAAAPTAAALTADPAATTAVGAHREGASR